MAPSISSARTTDRMGPNSSSRHSGMSGVTPSKIVGPRKNPFDGPTPRPSATIFAPPSSPWSM